MSVACSAGSVPSELQVQAPIKFELVINLKTTKALAIDVPAQLELQTI